MAKSALFPDPALLVDAKARFDFWESHYREFLQAYPEQYVAVRAGQVVATAPDLVAILAALTELGLKATDEDIDLDFVTAQTRMLIL